MSPTAIRIGKVVVSLASVGLSFASDKIADKKLDDKVAKKVAEALSNLHK